MALLVPFCHLVMVSFDLWGLLSRQNVGEKLHKAAKDCLLIDSNVCKDTIFFLSVLHFAFWSILYMNLGWGYGLPLPVKDVGFAQSALPLQEGSLPEGSIHMCRRMQRD